MKTFETMYTGDIRAIQITIWDQNDEAWLPSTVFAKVVNSDGEIISIEQLCLIIDNSAATIVPLAVTEFAGTYEVIWRIVKVVGSDIFTYYHKTELRVEEI